MTSQEIGNTVREYGGVLHFKIYAVICASDQIDHIRRDGEWINL